VNQFLALLPVLLNTLATAGSALNPHVNSVLGAMATLIEQGEEAFPKFQALTDHVVTAFKGDEPPTAEAVNTLTDHIAASAPGAPAVVPPAA
jgi:hypothetical protein